MTYTEKATTALEIAKNRLEKATAKVARNEKKLAAAKAENNALNIEWAEYDLRRAKHDLESAQANYDKKLVALNIAKAKDAATASLPESVKQMIAHVKKMRYEDLVQYKQELKEKTENGMNWKEVKKLSAWEQEIMYASDSSLKRYADMAGEAFVLDLVQRTKKVVGEITDWGYLRFSDCALEGIVHGTKGTAAVFTIQAGGYNIQRRHYRVLVKRRAA